MPSPDWFIGIDGFDLCVNGNWLDSITIEVSITCITDLFLIYLFFVFGLGDQCVNVCGVNFNVCSSQVDPIDAGTDNGFTFTAPNWPTDPQGVAYRITSHYPAHPAGSFFYPNLKRLSAIGTFQFIKVSAYKLHLKTFNVFLYLICILLFIR